MRSLAAPTVLAPGLFVLIWATGFVAARYVVPVSDPIAFVALRIAATTVILGGLCLLRPTRWPSSGPGWRAAIVAGILMQGVYVAGVFWSVAHGLPAGIAALVGSLQPLLTAAVAGPVLGERVSPRRWAGIGLGFAGTATVLAPKLGAVDAAGIPVTALTVSLVAMIAMTVGTLWQKRRGEAVDLLANTALQFVGASLFLLPLALLVAEWRFVFGAPLAFGFAWSVLVNSVAGILLLMALIRRGAVAGVASLLFLVPPVSALLAFALFGETLNPVQIVGMIVAAAGVALASRG